MKALTRSSTLLNHLQGNLQSLLPATTLIVSSCAPEVSGNSNTSPKKVDQSVKTFHKAVDTQIQECIFLTSLKFNLKTVPCKISSAFPTPSDVTSGLELMKRTGATNIIGVGSGVAMDLAKSLHLTSRTDDSASQPLILVPGTLGGVMAAYASETLLLNSNEESLVPVHNVRSKNGVDDEIDKTILIDERSLAIPNFTNVSRGKRFTENVNTSIATIDDIALSSLVISIDAALALDGQQNRGMDELVVKCVRNSLSCLNFFENDSIFNSTNEIPAELKSNSVQSAICAGQLLTFGLGDDLSSPFQRRSLPLTLSSGILPRHFPHGHWMTFTGSLLPGLISTIKMMRIDSNSTLLNKIMIEIEAGMKRVIYQKQIEKDWIEQLTRDTRIPSLSSLAEGTPPIQELMKDIQANSALVNCTDLDLNILENVLLSNLNR